MFLGNISKKGNISPLSNPKDETVYPSNLMLQCFYKNCDPRSGRILIGFKGHVYLMVTNFYINFSSWLICKILNELCRLSSRDKFSQFLLI